MVITSLTIACPVNATNNKSLYIAVYFGKTTIYRSTSLEGACLEQQDGRINPVVRNVLRQDTSPDVSGPISSQVLWRVEIMKVGIFESAVRGVQPSDAQ